MLRHPTRRPPFPFVALCVLATSLTALAVCPTRAFADVTEAQRTEAQRVCTGFAEMVEDANGDCEVLGTKLDTFITKNEASLEMFVGLDPSELEPVCIEHVEPTVEPIIACVQTESVAAAMIRLRQLHDEALAVAQRDESASE